MRLFVACPLALAAACAAPSIAPAEAETSWAVAPDGARIAYEQHGTGSPALVFVHGWAGERELWRATLEDLARDHRVLALDLAGHGQSEPRRGPATPQAFAADVVAVVRAAGLDDVVLIGHSYGAPLALLAAPALAPAVRAVIAVEGLHDAEFRYPPGYLAAAADELERDFPRALEASLRASLGAGVPADVADWIVARGLRSERTTAIAALRGLADFELAPALSAAGVPVRALNAAPDGAGRPATAVDTNRRLADFDVRLLERVGHFPMLERPAPFRAALRALLAELPPPAPPR